MTAELVLRRGLVDGTGARHRRVALRPLGGHEEAALAEAGGGRPPEEAVHALLAACVERLGGYHDVTPALAAALSRGDRQRLALALRALMVGDRLVLTLRCPAAGCGELADLDVTVTSLLDEGASADAEPESWAVDTPDGPLRLRPPTGLDDEVCAAVPSGPAEQAAVLWDRLVRAADGAARPAWPALDPRSRQALARSLAESGSLPDLTFVSACPACGALLELELDPFELLARELATGTDRLLAEVHSLAFHYGWSERAILGLPRPRRRRYLELLRRQVQGRPLV